MPDRKFKMVSPSVKDAQDDRGHSPNVETQARPRQELQDTMSDGFVHVGLQQVKTAGWMRSNVMR